MSTKSDSTISRREFARRAALVSAAASLAPSNLLGAGAKSVAAGPPEQQPAKAPRLSPEGQAEVETRMQSILAQYGGRLSEAQKADIRRLAAESQLSLERLRAFQTENGDGPALYLKPLMEREKKPALTPAIVKPASPPKNS